MNLVAAKEEFSGLDAVSELLKDKDIETNERGRRLLEQYGYWGNNGNAFYPQFRHQVMVTGAVSTVICVLLLIILFYWKKTEDACHQKILDQLEEILIRFRENKFDALLKTENPAELEKLNDQLEAIGHHIQLLKEEARFLLSLQFFHPQFRLFYLRRTLQSCHTVQELHQDPQ